MSAQVSQQADEKLHLVAGSGGCRAMLANLGMLLALNWLGKLKVASMGGISGGAIPFCLYAAGLSLEEIVDCAIGLDFETLVRPQEKLSSVLKTHYQAGRRKGRLPGKGIYSMENFAKWLETRLKGEWPRRELFWTMATDDNGAQVLFTENGMFKRIQGEAFQQIAAPARPESAICASCTVPGFFIPINLPLPTGGQLQLYDGALSFEGTRPLSVVDFFAFKQGTRLVFCDVGAERNNYDRLYNSIWRIICGGRCLPSYKAKTGEKNFGMPVVEILPTVTAVRSFEFSAPASRKWKAILEGFAATTQALTRSGLLSLEETMQARGLLQEVEHLEKACQEERLDFSVKLRALLILRGVLKS